MSKKVTQVILAEIESIDVKMRELLVERADLKAGAELFEPKIQIDNATIIFGNIPKTKINHIVKKDNITVAKGIFAKKITRRTYNKSNGNTIFISGSVLFKNRIQSNISSRTLFNKFKNHLLETGYIIKSPNKIGYIATEIGKPYIRAYESTGIKFYPHLFDDLIEECAFIYDKKIKEKSV